MIKEIYNKTINIKLNIIFFDFITFRCLLQAHVERLFLETFLTMRFVKKYFFRLLINCIIRNVNIGSFECLLS